MWLIHLAQLDKTPTLTSIVAESIPHLKRGAMRDFKNIMETHNHWKDNQWSVSDSTYTFGNGSKIEFFSTDSGDKLRGARRDRLFVNEANNVRFDAFEQLEVRTRQFVYLDWNPTNEFWFYTEVKGKRDDVQHVIVTYLDNEGVPEEIKKSIEQRKNRKGWWQVYGLGQLGEVEGKIYKDWQIIDDIPHEARLERRGLDFGYTNDPTAIIDIYYYNGGYIFDERLYQKGMSNHQIAEALKNMDTTLTIADSAEPKSIDEIRSYGISVMGADKRAGSIRQGIQFIQGNRISVTSRSVNLIKEYRNYLWKVDRDGKILNEPDGGLDHACFTKDTIIGLPIGSVIKTVPTGVKDIYSFIGQKVTGDHPYLTTRGFVRLDSIRYCDKLVTWKNKQLMELPLDGTRTQTGASLKTILYLVQRNLSAIKLNVYTGIYGNSIMEKYLKAFISTIKMGTHLIMTYLISNVSLLNNTTNYIIKKTSQSGEEVWILLESMQYTGTAQRRVLSFIKRLALCHIKMIQRLYKSVSFVVKNTKSGKHNQKEKNTATIIAKLKHLGKEEVYATTTTSGYFTVGSVVVSNCDAARYGMSTLAPKKQEIQRTMYNRSVAQRLRKDNFI